MKVKKSIPNILTPEDKKLLKRTGYYLKSLGHDTGVIRSYLDGGDLDEDSFEWNRIGHFDNIYGTEIPNFIFPILQKILTYVIENDLYRTPDVDDISSSAADFSIDADKQEVSLSFDYSYYETDESQGTEWEAGEDEELEKAFKSLEEEAENYKQKLTLRYSGSGDSGYLEDFFEEGGSVPEDVSEWAYRQLENQHGGWEINEGSQGYFIFNNENRTAILEHSYNQEQNVTDTLFEESYA